MQGKTKFTGHPAGSIWYIFALAPRVKSSHHTTTQMSEFYGLHAPELTPEQEKVFAHAMSPAWSRASTTSHRVKGSADKEAAKEEDNSKHRKLLKKLNKIFS